MPKHDLLALMSISWCEMVQNSSHTSSRSTAAVGSVGRGILVQVSLQASGPNHVRDNLRGA
jgi:hypothetical protein